MRSRASLLNFLGFTVLAALAVSMSLAVLAPATAAAAPGDAVGSAVRVVNKVTAEAGAAERALAQGDEVRQDEIIAVAPESLGELRLRDETRLALGPGARLKLDTFVYDPDAASGTIAVDLTKGAFRFITGLAKKPSYVIRSPSASISVRGTVFDVYVEPNGTLWVLLHEGSIEVCNSQSVCRVVDDPCGIVRVLPGGVLSDVGTWNRQPFVREIDFETAFPFVVRPPQVDPAPRYTRANVETGTCIADGIPDPERPRRAEAPGGGAPAGGLPSSVPARQSRVEDSIDEPAVYEAPPAPAAPLQSQRWSGTYVGITLGTAYQPGNTEVACDDPGASFDGVAPDCLFAIEIGALETRYDTKDLGFIGGAQIGINWQSGQIVLGLEADVSGSTVDGRDHEFKVVPPISPGERTVRQELHWLSTLRLRAGVVTGDWLLYGTAGLAFGEVQYQYEAEYSGGFAYARLQTTEIEVGWTAGLGAEADLGGGWSLKGEYLFYDLGDRDFSTEFIAPLPTPVFFEPEFENIGHIGRIGINFRLN